jgi:hypothetical protein
MRLVQRQREHGKVLYGLIYGVIALCALAAARYLPILDLLPLCVFRGVTGLSCPTCGSTRALLYLAGGDLAAALSLNPLIVLIVLTVIAWMVADIVQLLLPSRVPSIVLTRTEGTAIRVLAVLLFLGNWAFLLFRHGQP